MLLEITKNDSRETVTVVRKYKLGQEPKDAPACRRPSPEDRIGTVEDIRRE